MVMGIISGIAGSAVLGWLRRRVVEVAGVAGTVLPFILAMPPEQQAVIVAILTGQGGSLSLIAFAGFITYVVGQWRSWRATVNPHVVADKNMVELTEEQARQKVYEETGIYPTNKVERR